MQVNKIVLSSIENLVDLILYGNFRNLKLKFFDGVIDGFLKEEAGQQAIVEETTGD